MIVSDAIHVEVSSEHLNINEAISFVSNDGYGAIDLFVGVVRNTHEGKDVTGISYDVHKPLAEKNMKEICDEAQSKWANTKYYVSHYHGSLDVGGVSVVIAVGAAHRGDVFEACRYVIEEIKKRTPVWKKEHYVAEESAWLPGQSLANQKKSESSCCGKCGG